MEEKGPIGLRTKMALATVEVINARHGAYAGGQRIVLDTVLGTKAVQPWKASLFQNRNECQHYVHAVLPNESHVNEL